MSIALLNLDLSGNVWKSVAFATRDFVESNARARLVVPCPQHIDLANSALRSVGVAPGRVQVCTLDSWVARLAEVMPLIPAEPENRRLMMLYSELRQHEWLKNLFGVKSNADLFPLAQTLLALCDEISAALLPGLDLESGAAQERWEAALEQLPAPVRALLSDESQLVWTIWKSQLDCSDPQSVRLSHLSYLAENETGPLIWLSAGSMTRMDSWFINAYSQCNPVLQLGVDWSAASLPGFVRAAWSEVVDQDDDDVPMQEVKRPHSLALLSAKSLEEEAQKGAQQVVNWLQSGRKSVAIAAQDRAVARRIRALLERAQIFVADETGWKLSTTRAATVLSTILELAATERSALLLDLLKSPFLLSDLEGKAGHVAAIELAIRKANVFVGWQPIASALKRLELESATVDVLRSELSVLCGSKSVSDWASSTLQVFSGLEMIEALELDAAGARVVAFLRSVVDSFDGASHPCTLAEWRAFVAMQLEAETFVAPGTDRRVVMLSLAGSRFRIFDAVLLVGADARHLPSQPAETMFFANAVRRELGLSTREESQKQQMRDLVQLVLSGAEVVLSRQTHAHGEIVPVSPWVERLQLALATHGEEPVPELSVGLPVVKLAWRAPSPDPVSAPSLTPDKLSPSSYNSLMACPYQFFVSHMLGLAAMDDVNETPEKRNYGNWLHEILNEFHITLRDKKVPDRDALLRDISDKVFTRELAKMPSALGYYARWKKVIPTYLEWTEQREAEGWRFARGEQKLEKVLTWESGAITLHGRVDRLDVNDAEEQAVLDYKSTGLAGLNSRLKDGEDQQLPFYGILSDANVVCGEFVSLEMNDSKKASAVAKNFGDWQEKLEQSIIRNVIAIKSGEAMPANGTPQACEYCDARGLCRRKIGV